MEADLQLLRRVAGQAASFSIDVDEWPEAVGFAAYDGDHEWQAEGSGSSERFWGAADAEPDREFFLHRPWEDALPSERCAALARPVDVGVVADREEKVKVFGEEEVVVVQVEAEEGEGFDEGAAADYHFGAAAGDQVEGGEALEGTYGIDCAQDGDGAGEPDSAGSGCCGGEDHVGGRVEEFLPVVFAYPEDVEASLIGVLDASEELTHAEGGLSGACGLGGDETVDSDLHMDWGKST